MKKLICDFDDVICDNKILDLLNEYMKTNFTEQDMTEAYTMDDLFDDQEKIKDAYRYVVDKNIYTGANLKEDAYDVLERMQEKYDYEIFICSACLINGYENLFGKVFMDKYNFITKVLPFVKPQNIILTNAKHVVTGDVVIDDRLINLQGQFKTKLLFDRFTNRQITDEELSNKNVIRVRNWKEIEKILINKETFWFIKLDW